MAVARRTPKEMATQSTKHSADGLEIHTVSNLRSLNSDSGSHAKKSLLQTLGRISGSIQQGGREIEVPQLRVEIQCTEMTNDLS